MAKRRRRSADHAIHNILVKNKKVIFNSAPVTTTQDVVVWNPSSTNDLIDIIFENDSPVGAPRLTAPFPGIPVRAFITVVVESRTHFKYGFARSAVRAEPEIIVDPGGKKKRRSRKKR
jgi:hypothetical protein